MVSTLAIKKRHTKKVELFDVINITLLVIVCTSMLYPFLNLLFISVSKQSDVTAAGGILLFPKSINFEAYEYIWNYRNLWTNYKNTIIVTLAGTSFSLVMTLSGGYSLSKKNLPGRKYMTLYLLITMFIGGGLIPGYLNIRDFGMLNSLWSLIIPGVVSAWNIFLARNFFMGVPEDLKESAYIDGATEVRTMWSIVLPLSMPLVATLALFHAVSEWNCYTDALIYNPKQEYQTLQCIVKQMYSSSSDEMNALMQDDMGVPPTDVVRGATVIFTTAPILIVYPFLQKYFTKGVMVGSLKG